jgi:hypothetical protein
VGVQISEADLFFKRERRDGMVFGTVGTIHEICLYVQSSIVKYHFLISSCF